MLNSVVNLTFREPLWLLLCLLPFMTLLVSQFSTQDDDTFADKSLRPWILYPASLINRNILLRNTILTLSWCFFCVALAGPRQIDHQYQGSAVIQSEFVFVLDVSHSMGAIDISPNRVGRAKIAIKDFIQNSAGIAYGLVVFSAQAHIVVPPTSDKEAVLLALQQMDVNVLPSKGSRVIPALEQAISSFHNRTAVTKHVIMLSDGDFSSEDVPEDRITLLFNRSDIVLHTWGVGRSEGSAIPGIDEPWLSHKHEPVLTQLNESTLKMLAGIGKGSYSKPDQSRLDWMHTSLRQWVDPGDDDSLSGKITVWKELYPWALVPALVLYFLGVSRRVQSRRRNEYGTGKSGQLLGILILVGLGHVFYTPSSYAEDVTVTYRHAWKAYAAKDYKNAEQLFSKLDGYSRLFGLGNVAYIRKNYSQAARYYSGAVLAAKDSNRRADAVFNLANSYFSIGNYEESVRLYNDVLKYRPEDKSARINLGFAVELFKQVRREMEKQQMLFGSRGPRAAAVADGTEPRGRIRLDDTEPPPEKKVQKLSVLPANWVNRGIQYAKLAAQNKDLNSTQQHFRISDTQQLMGILNSETTHDFSLWKRLFELEQDFQAPLEKPVVLEGVRPW
ncbi:MAG: VWA domain-containing protein [Gammaproteobacteria bacterium]|nr:VWA domain-containing protein [Gammaproteobacteria bacterium]MDH5802313.1 VWA domain-containing protein [Gammaproteobacteria bacterium]